MKFLERMLAPLFLFDDDPGGGGGSGDDNPAAKPEKSDKGGDGKDGPKPESKPPWGGSDDDFDPARAWKLIQGVRSDLDKQKSRADEAEKKAKGYEDKGKTDQQKLEDRATGAEKDRDTHKAEAARLRVALKKGLNETQAKRLVGEDEEALEKDADELLESFKSDDDGDQGSSRRPKERLRPGAAPGAEPDEQDPAKLAEQVSRGY